MSSRTAADICRERGWGPGTEVVANPGGKPWTITAIGQEKILLQLEFAEHEAGGDISHWREHDPDAELVGAMAAVMPAARFDLYGEYELRPEAPLRDEHQVMARAALGVLRDRGECFHPDHGDEMQYVVQRHKNTIGVLDAYKAHHEKFHPDCDISGPPPLPHFDRETEQP